MRQWFFLGMVLAPGFALIGSPARGQFVERERDVKVTGPRGRSIERSIVSGRGPGMIDRQVTIQRPGGTFHSSASAFAARPPAHVRSAPVFPTGGFGRPGYHGGYGGRPIIERDVIINNGGGFGGFGGSSWLAPLAVGGGLLGLGMFAGSALASRPPPPPPVYAVPAPVYVAPAPPPTVVYNPPQPYVAPPQPQTVVIDPVANALARLQSDHDNSRRDGAYTLGRLRDPRALPALADLLKYDEDTDVRIAAATALGDIGDPRAAIYLERVTIYDKKQKVRDAAAVALSRMPREVYTPQSQPPQQQRQPQVQQMPMQSGPAVTPPSSIPLDSGPFEQVPPPPTPVTSGPGFRDQP
jgi:HEAT repeats